jgi:hypothetical protein
MLEKFYSGYLFRILYGEWKGLAVLIQEKGNVSLSFFNVRFIKFRKHSCWIDHSCYPNEGLSIPSTYYI